MAVLVRGCSAAPARPPPPVPQQAVTAALAAADALFFENHYDQAQRGYPQLVARAPGAPPPHAAYARFLNHPMDFTAAPPPAPARGAPGARRGGRPAGRAR